MGGQAAQIEPSGVQLHLAGGLGQIAMQQGAGGADTRGDVGDWLYGPNLVVHRSDRHQPHRTVEQHIKALQIKLAVAAQRRTAHIVPSRAQVIGSPQYRWMFSRRHHDGPATLRIKVIGNPEQC